MKTSLIIGLSLVFINIGFAHHEWVHQYQVKQAYLLLKNQIGNDIPELSDYIGLSASGAGARMWNEGLVSVGAWREDLEDIVWEVGDFNCGYTPSITHFWDADKHGFPDLPVIDQDTGVGLTVPPSVESLKRSSNTRTVSVYTGVGFLELLVLGAQYQINERYAIGAKADIVFLGSSSVLPSAGVGGGIKASYFFDETGSDKFLGFNAVNFEASYLGFGIRPSQFARGLELTLGHDSFVGHGFGLFWALGVAYSVSTDHPALFFPAFKIGLHLDM
jgi:hypothetical protein